MSTGPGPTRKADGSAEASVDDIADLLVEDESHQGRMEGEQSLDDGLDVMLETPGPALVSTFMPPPPAPVAEDADESESSESVEEPGESTNLAYEDLLAKLVLPAKAPEPESALPALAAPLPMPETLMAPALPTPPALAFNRPSSANFQIAPSMEERTLVTVNPLVAEEQEAAYREGRSASREQPLMIQEEMRPAPTEPMVGSANVGGARSRFRDLMLGGLLVLGGFILAVLFLKLIMPTPAPQPPVVITPALPPPPSAPPAHVEPLPPSPAPPSAPAAAQPEAEAPVAAQPEHAAPAAEDALPAQPKAHRTAARKVAHAAAPKPGPAPKPVTAAVPKAALAPAPAAKAPKAPAGKKSKGSGYADPFDN